MRKAIAVLLAITIFTSISACTALAGYEAGKWTYDYENPFSDRNSFNRGGYLNISEYVEGYCTYIYDIVRECIHSGKFKSKTAADDAITFWYDGYGLVRRAVLAEGAQGNKYSETYYYDEGGNFVFAYYESSQYGQHRMYFYGDTMVKWKYSPVTGDSVTYEAETELKEYQQMQEYTREEEKAVLKSANEKLHAVPVPAGKGNPLVVKPAPTQPPVFLNPTVPPQPDYSAQNLATDADVQYRDILELYTSLACSNPDHSLGRMIYGDIEAIESNSKYQRCYTGSYYSSREEREDDDHFTFWNLSVVNENTSIDGWSLADLNNDGTDELIVWDTGKGRISYIYTLQDGSPYLVCNSDKNFSYYLMPDNSILYRWVGGEDTVTAYRLIFDGKSFSIEENLSINKGSGTGVYNADEAKEKLTEYIGKSVICAYTDF